jgi:hypothetical protein
MSLSIRSEYYPNIQTVLAQGQSGVWRIQVWILFGKLFPEHLIVTKCYFNQRPRKVENLHKTRLCTSHLAQTAGVGHEPPQNDLLFEFLAFGYVRV